MLRTSQKYSAGRDQSLQNWKEMGADHITLCAVCRAEQKVYNMGLPYLSG